MKAIKKIMMGAWVVLIIAACGREGGKDTAVAEEEFREDISILQDSLKNMEKDFRLTLDDIDKNLAEISTRQAGIALGAGSPLEEGISRKEKIIRNISIINRLLDENKMKIAVLNSQVKKYHLENTRLKNLTANAEKDILDRDRELEQLKIQLISENYHVAELNQRVDSLEWNNAALTGKLNSYDTELHKAYYAEGTHKELREMGVIGHKGGVLGIGRTPVLKEDFPEEKFAQIDTRKTTHIPLNVKKAKLITSHPENSYQFVEANGLVASLDILDPEMFWRTGKHMVVEEVR